MKVRARGVEMGVLGWALTICLGLAAALYALALLAVISVLAGVIVGLDWLWRKVSS